MVKSSADRRNKYGAKIDGNIISGRYEATKNLAVRKQTEYFGNAVKLENEVKVIVDGEPSFLQHFYIAFAEEIAKKHTQAEWEIAFQKWWNRGLNGNILDAIAKAIANEYQSVLKLYEYYITGDSVAQSIYGVEWEAQTFTVGEVGLNENFNTSSVKLFLYRTLLPGTITVSIQGVDGANKPDGIDLAIGTTTGNDLPIGAPYEWREITLTPFELQAGTQYAIVVRALTGDADNRVNWRADSLSPTYAGGNRLTSNNNGVTWNNFIGQDFMFEVWGIGPQF